MLTYPIDKLRKMTLWLNQHHEAFLQQFNDFTSFERLYDFAMENKFEFLDSEYIYGELWGIEREKALEFIKKEKNRKPRKK